MASRDPDFTARWSAIDASSRGEGRARNRPVQANCPGSRADRLESMNIDLPGFPRYPGHQGLVVLLAQRSPEKPPVAATT